MNALMLASYFLRNLNLDGRSAHRVRTSNFVPSHSAWCRARNLSILTVTFVGLLCATSLASTTSDQSTAPELARSRIAPPVLKNVAVHPALRTFRTARVYVRRLEGDAGAASERRSSLSLEWTKHANGDRACRGGRQSADALYRRRCSSGVVAGKRGPHT